MAWVLLYIICRIYIRCFFYPLFLMMYIWIEVDYYGYFFSALILNIIFFGINEFFKYVLEIFTLEVLAKVKNLLLFLVVDKVFSKPFIHKAFSKPFDNEPFW